MPPLLLLGCFVLLLLVFVPVLGIRVNGARRWINLGVVGFQSVEAVKLILIVLLASYLVRYRDNVQTRAVRRAQAARRRRRPDGAVAGAAGLRLRDAADGHHARHGLARWRARAQPRLARRCRAPCWRAPR